MILLAQKTFILLLLSPLFPPLKFKLEFEYLVFLGRSGYVFIIQGQQLALRI